MGDSGVTVRDLLPGEFNEMDSVLQTKLSRDPAMGFASKMWGFIGSKATDAIRDCLNFDVVELLGRGWETAQELHEYKDQHKHPANETSIVTLGKHKMTTAFDTVLVVTVGPKSWDLPFTLEMTAHIDTMALSICNAHITGLGSGECSVEAQLKYKQAPLHKAIQSRKVTLPGHHDFKAPGLPIV